MDTRQFDLIVRSLAVGTSRRRVLGRLAGSTAGSLLALIGAGPVAAQDDGKDDKDKDKGNDGNRDRPECRGEGHPCEGNQDCCEDQGLTCGESEPGAARRCIRAQAVFTAVQDGNEAQCRKAGETCGGDQLCCEGLPCETGKDGVDRCGGGEACEADCPTEEVKVSKIRAYRVETECAYDDASDRTTCNCAARGEANAPRVRRVTLPQADICAEVVGGEFEVVDNSVNTATAGTGGQANAEASGGQVVVQGGDDVTVDASGGQAVADASGGSGNVAIAGGGRGVRYASPRERETLTLSFAGKVTASGTATYWCETDNGLVPATGPALVRDQEEIPADAGVLIVRAMACNVDKPADGFDWYGQCQQPAGKTRFRLKQLEGEQEVEKQNAETDDEGRRNFRGLAPGTYRLAPEGKGWCHAECDSADDKGDVLIEAGKRTTLWVFNCAKAT